MYWFCFGDSALGLLHCARHDLDPQMELGHIYGLMDDNSQGDIAGVSGRAMRERIFFPSCGEADADRQWEQELLARHRQALDALDETDEAVIWCGSSAQEQCGLRYVADRLYARHIPVWLVEVGEIPLSEITEPDHTADGPSGCIVMKKSGRQPHIPRFAVRWLVRLGLYRAKRQRRRAAAHGDKVRYAGVGEMEMGAAKYFYDRRRLLGEAELAALAEEWCRLREENTPLRVPVNGKVQSVPADFYDNMILSCVPEQTGAAAQAVGRALAEIDRRTGSRVGDRLVFRRIRALAAVGKIEIVRDAVEGYRDMTLRKSRVDRPARDMLSY